MDRASQLKPGLEGPPLVGIDEAVRLLHHVLSRSSVYRAVRAGMIPSVRIGHRLFVRRSWLEGLFDDEPNERNEEQDR